MFVEWITHWLLVVADHRFALAAVIIIATFVLEDSATVAVGLLASQMVLAPMPALAALVAGTILGDLGLHILGRWAGGTRRGKRLLARFTLSRPWAWLRTRSLLTIAGARFVPGLRLPVYLGSGLFRTAFIPSALVIIVVGCVWTPALFWLAMTGSGAAVAWFGQAGLLIGLTAMCIAALAPHLVAHSLSLSRRERLGISVESRDPPSSTQRNHHWRRRR